MVHHNLLIIIILCVSRIVKSETKKISWFNQLLHINFALIPDQEVDKLFTKCEIIYKMKYNWNKNWVIYENWLYNKNLCKKRCP